MPLIEDDDLAVFRVGREAVVRLGVQMRRLFEHDHVHPLGDGPVSSLELLDRLETGLVLLLQLRQALEPFMARSSSARCFIAARSSSLNPWPWHPSSRGLTEE